MKSFTLRMACTTQHNTIDTHGQKCKTYIRELKCLIICVACIRRTRFLCTKYTFGEIDFLFLWDQGDQLCSILIYTALIH